MRRKSLIEMYQHLVLAIIVKVNSIFQSIEINLDFISEHFIFKYRYQILKIRRR
jgi:hypothetical protein